MNHSIRLIRYLILLSSFSALNFASLRGAEPDSIEGDLKHFLGEPRFEMQQVFKSGRFPNVAVALDGTVLATWGNNGVRVRRSEDGGKTWPVKRLVFDGPSAYSSLNAGRPGTASEGWIYLHFEDGPGGGSQVARFNFSWILDGQATGDGKLPESN